jgi:hypothetical protein
MICAILIRALQMVLECALLIALPFLPILLTYDEEPQPGSEVVPPGLLA